MAANAADYFIKVRQNFSTTIGAGGVADGTTTTIPLTSVANLPTDTAIELVVNRVTTAGVVTNNYETVRGIISGSNLTNVVRGVEGTAQGWDAGVVVEYLATADIQNRLVTGILVEHSQAGAHNTATIAMLAGAQTFTGGKTYSQSALFNSGITVSQSAIFNSAAYFNGAIVGQQSAIFNSGVYANRLIPSAIPGADHSANGIIESLTAHETQAFGDVGYVSSTGDVALGNASVIASANVVAMCADVATTAAVAANYLFYGIARDDSWNWTPGGLIYLSTTGTTGNTLTQTAPAAADNVIQVIGQATHADRMIFHPQLVQIEHV